MARLGQEPVAPPEHVDRWIDEGPVREEAVAAVRRSEPQRRGSGELAPEVVESVVKSAGSSQRAALLRERLLKGFLALERDRFLDARRIGNQLARELKDTAAVYELIGLANYRLGAWRQAAVALERAQSLNPDPDTLPVLMDCLRGMKRYDDVADVWRELRAASPSHEVMIEGRIIMAGTLSDQGDFSGAIKELQAARQQPKRVRDYHLRQWYVLADLLDRAGDWIGARRYFELVARHDAEFVDVRQRLRALGR